MSSEIPFHLIPDEILDLCRQLREASHEAHLVGGGVRDLLLGRPVNDWDVATSARPEQVQALFKRTVPIGIKHGTVAVVLPGQQVEVTTYRSESRYSDGRHPDRVVFVSTLQEDLERRDFTINAIALDPGQRRVFDPMRGRSDLERKLIRAVGDPRARFSEDGLRPMRAVRFAAVLEFSVEQLTLEAITSSLDVFRQVSNERVRDELLKLLEAREPSRGLELMLRSRLLPEVLPELAGADLYEAGVDACDATDGDAILRLAALLHRLTEKQLTAIARRLRLSNRQRQQIVRTTTSLRSLELTDEEQTPAGLRRLARRLGPEHLDSLIALRSGILRGSGDQPGLQRLERLREALRQVLAERPPLSTAELAVDGNTIVERLGTGPGPVVGRILESLLERVIEDPSLNEEQILLEIADELAGEE
jgi:tRNA nucleotidyltransferase (CCA-adding enzyme)